ncbi:hypothetical protein PVK06_003334 [Gossypium arboreum]|uniref:Uncharacterized protein n=1 Tax=Gossypium arboreum TaxID=29729 RepID=A0ABR0R640_GOSAR|nr:hypothetical protein PVK06_003334 [Gossypium arboreum]
MLSPGNKSMQNSTMVDVTTYHAHVLGLVSNLDLRDKKVTMAHYKHTNLELLLNLQNPSFTLFYYLQDKLMIVLSNSELQLHPGKRITKQEVVQIPLPPISWAAE